MGISFFFFLFLWFSSKQIAQEYTATFRFYLANEKASFVNQK